ncbi:serine/threonine-protein kinase [Actinomadura terrae]|uniref:serine/threonine-protein kinase n=1 Tax=Actinomadura terrae TaxID=604353 RepID=UPI001FA6AB77|nr:serine/threonine-protein kinase [Actinomadura terrae]
MRRGDLLGERGRYELDQAIGRGGMGEVWRAYDRFLDRRLAVKFTFVRGAPDEALVSRFEQEARGTAWLEHPGVPTVYDFGEHRDEVGGPCFYLVMQYVEGMTVGDLVDAHERLPVSWAALIAAQVAAVLSVAHRRPLVHRDLKPRNLMLCGDGSVKVLDFGASVSLGPQDSRATTTGFGGPYTPGYAALEQVYGSPEPRSDLYSLGCVLYEMLTGRQVFPGVTPYEVIRRHEDETPVPPRFHRQDVPPGLDALVLRLLAKRPDDRPADAEEVYHRLREFIGPLEPLPGAVDATTSVRLYGDIVSRIEIAETAPAVAPVVKPTVLPDVDDVVEARAESAVLSEGGRYTQAAGILSDMIEPARLALGDDDPEYMGLRLDLADVLFRGGDHRRAVVAYGKLAVELAEWYGPDDAEVLRCREQEALCHTRLGATAAAIRSLEELLDDVTYEGPYNETAFRLREQMARLWLAAGRTGEARREITALADDLRGLHGDDHPRVGDLEALLNELG